MFDDVGHPALVLGVLFFMGFQLGRPMLPPGGSMVIRRILGPIGTSVFAIPSILGSPCCPDKAGLADD